MVRVAKEFSDYNFRTYFKNLINDDFVKLQQLPEEKQRNFLQTRGKQRLREMQRMVLVNKLFGSQLHIVDVKENRK